MNNECNVTCYKIYEHIESCNQHRPQKAWMLAQSVFFQSLSHDEHLTLLTYSAYGEEIDQHCTRQSDTHRLTDIGYYKRTADWYVATIDSLQYLMFQPQICKVFGYSTTLSPEDIKRISFDMQTWDIQRWHRVFEVYMQDIQRLFLKAPPLQYPMTSFRGEPNTAPQMLKARTRINLLSSSLDASVAAFWAHEPGLLYKTLPVGTIYKITWPVGTRLIFALGSLDDTAQMELYAHNTLLQESAATEPHEGVCVTWERTIPSPGVPLGTIHATYKFCDLEADAFE